MYSLREPKKLFEDNYITPAGYKKIRKTAKSMAKMAWKNNKYGYTRLELVEKAQEKLGAFGYKWDVYQSLNLNIVFEYILQAFAELRENGLEMTARQENILAFQWQKKLLELNEIKIFRQVIRLFWQQKKELPAIDDIYASIPKNAFYLDSYADIGELLQKQEQAFEEAPND